jgi:hypothetical protein
MSKGLDEIGLAMNAGASLASGIACLHEPQAKRKSEERQKKRSFASQRAKVAR